MHLVRLVTAKIAVFSLGRIVEDELSRILLAHRNHVVRDHLAHVDKRHVEFFGEALVERRITAVAVMNLRRGIVIQAANRAHDNRVRALRADIAHHLLHVGSEEILGTVVHVIDSELDHDVVARLEFFSDAVAIGATFLEEHVVIADSGITLLVKTAATERHAALVGSNQ